MNKQDERKIRIIETAALFQFMLREPVNFVKYLENRPSDGKDILFAEIRFINHEYYGLTKLSVFESYDSKGSLQYHYGWEKEKGSKLTRHITAWGNEPHFGHRKVNTEPFHHHHIPGEPSERQECCYIKSLKDVLEFLSEYVERSLEYRPTRT